MHAQEANGGGGGLICYMESEAEGADGENSKRLFLTFEGADVKGRTGRLNKGDHVQFFITTDARTGKRRATQVCTAWLTAQRYPDLVQALL